jgi:hypothetical protein
MIVKIKHFHSQIFSWSSSFSTNDISDVKLKYQEILKIVFLIDLFRIYKIFSFQTPQCIGLSRFSSYIIDHGTSEKHKKRMINELALEQHSWNYKRKASLKISRKTSATLLCWADNSLCIYIQKYVLFAVYYISGGSRFSSSVFFTGCAIRNTSLPPHQWGSRQEKLINSGCAWKKNKQPHHRQESTSSSPPSARCLPNTCQVCVREAKGCNFFFENDNTCKF